MDCESTTLFTVHKIEQIYTSLQSWFALPRNFLESSGLEAGELLASTRNMFFRPKEVPFVSKKDLQDLDSHHLSSKDQSASEPEDSQVRSMEELSRGTGVVGLVLLLRCSLPTLEVSLLMYSSCWVPMLIILSVSLSALLDLFGLLLPSSSFGRASRHTACSNFDRGLSGHRSWRERLRPLSVISTVF